MSTEAIEEDLQILDHKLSQLRRDYDQYFLGTRPREPILLRGEVQKAIVRLTNTHFKNTAARFKFSSVCSRFQAFRRQWDETLRKIEAGTYERHRFKAKIHSAEREASGKTAAGKAAGSAAGGEEDLYQNYVDARLACGQDVKGVTRRKLERVIDQQTRQLHSKFGPDARFSFRVAVEDGKVRLKAARQRD